MAASFWSRAARPLAGAVGVVPLVGWCRQSTLCEDKPAAPQFVKATCVKNEQHTHDTKKITLQLDSNWTSKGAVAFVQVRAGGASKETGCCACCTCPQPCGCPKQANGCCACCKCPDKCGCPKKEVAPVADCCACCKCPTGACACPKNANGCCSCCKCPDKCGCPKKEAPAETGCCACCKCPAGACTCPKTSNGCCACCKCPDKCGCPKQEVAKSASVTRNYNPLSADSGSEVTLLVKRYADAQMGTKLHGLKQGESVEVKGPFQQWKFTQGKYKHYGMVAGGTGITPLMQAADSILKNDTANITFTTYNKTPGDVVLRAELAALAESYPDRFKVVHFVEGGEKDPGCQQAGKCCMQRHLKELLPTPGDGVLIMVCGRAEMTGRVAGPKTPDFKQGEVGGILKEIGFETKHVHKF